MAVFSDLEIGAGNRGFAASFLTDPVVTDADPTKVLWDLDVKCRGERLPFESGSFALVIINNPYGYGFHAKDNTDALLQEVRRVLGDSGRLEVLGATANRHSRLTDVRRYAAQNGFVEINTVFGQDAIKQKFPGHTFYTTELVPTSPNFWIEFRA